MQSAPYHVISSVYVKYCKKSVYSPGKITLKLRNESYCACVGREWVAGGGDEAKCSDLTETQGSWRFKISPLEVSSDNFLNIKNTRHHPWFLVIKNNIRLIHFKFKYLYFILINVYNLVSHSFTFEAFLNKLYKL